MNFGLKVTIDGDLRALMAAEYMAGERAVSAAIRNAGISLKTAWRGQITGAGLGSRLANAVRSDSYPKGQPSLNAAAMVWSKAPKITAAHADGALIRSKDGFWLAIPTKAAGKGARGKKITPIEWEQRTGRALRFVYWGGRIAKLVDDGTIGHRRLSDDLSWTNKKAGKGRRRQSRLIFILVPQARLKKKLDLFGAADRVGAGLPAAIIANWRDAR